MKDPSVGKVVMVACGTFAATVVNDVLMLSIMYSESLQTDSTFRPVHVAIGQYVGLTFIIALSMLGLVMGSFLSTGYIGSLGIVPVLMGLYKYWLMLRRWWKGEEDEDEEEAIEELEIECGLKPEQPLSRAKPATASAPTSKWETKGWIRSFLTDTFCNSGILKAALMVIISSTDNLSVYTPRFATSKAWQIPITLVVFYSLIGLWCGFGYALISMPHVAKAISRWGHYVVPGVFIAVGAAIVWDDGSVDVLRLLAQDLREDR